MNVYYGTSASSLSTHSSKAPIIGGILSSIAAIVLLTGSATSLVRKRRAKSGTSSYDLHASTKTNDYVVTEIPVPEKPAELPVKPEPAELQ